jgi:hypothetical protein
VFCRKREEKKLNKKKRGIILYVRERERERLIHIHLGEKLIDIISSNFYFMFGTAYPFSLLEIDRNCLLFRIYRLRTY